MSLALAKSHLSQIIVGTVLSLLSLVSIVLYTDPFTSGLVTHFVFYVSLYFFVSGVAIVLGMYIRRYIAPNLYATTFWESFRQGMFVGIMVVACMLLQAQGLLFWWIVLGLVLFLVVCELLFSF